MIAVTSVLSAASSQTSATTFSRQLDDRTMLVDVGEPRHSIFYRFFYCADRYRLTRAGTAGRRSPEKPQLKGTIWHATGRDEPAIRSS